MIERRYVGVPTVGRTAHVLERIRQVVRSQNQTHVIPIMKIEKKARGQFYVFLAIEAVADNRLPDPIVNLLKMAGLTGRPIWPLTLAEIKDMVSNAEVETHGFSSLSYKPLWDRDVGDPYDLSEEPVFDTELEDPKLGERYDQLLYWLSANAEGTWETFVKACLVLQLVKDSKHARRIFRRLMLLGHVECSSDGSRWTICPPALVLCPTKSGIAFLCGQRTPKLLNSVSDTWALLEYPQKSHQGPSQIEVRCDQPAEGILELSCGIGLHITGTASMKIARLLPDLEGWKETLTPIEKLNTTNCSVERWDGKQYVTCTDFYQRGDDYVGASGLYRLTRGTAPGSHQMVLYFDCDQQKWLKGDWYGLRFLVYKDAGHDCEVIQHPGTNELVIPADERWPMLFERTLVLAAGQLPCPANNQKWLLYEGVSNELARFLTDKLNVSVEEKHHA